MFVIFKNRMTVEFILAALNSALVVGIIVLLIHFNNKINDLQNSVMDLLRYRQHNEVQLQNLINDINRNDEFLLNKNA